MATLEELLQEGDTDYIHDDVIFFIDSDLRIVTVPERGVVAGVVGDKNVNRINFQMVRYYNGFDMSKFLTRINYVNANGNPNYYNVDDLVVEDEYILFTWLIDSDAVAYAGSLLFAVRMFRADANGVIANDFNTRNDSSLLVLDGLRVDSAVPEEEKKDILEHLKSDMEAFINVKKKELSDLKTSMETDIASLKVETNSLKEDLGNLSIVKIGENKCTNKNEVYGSTIYLPVFLEKSKSYIIYNPTSETLKGCAINVVNSENDDILIAVKPTGWVFQNPKDKTQSFLSIVDDGWYRIRLSYQSVFTEEQKAMYGTGWMVKEIPTVDYVPTSFNYAEYKESVLAKESVNAEKANYAEKAGSIAQKEENVACTGDSLTYGYGASPGSTDYPTVLTKLCGKTVYNLGVSGESTDEILARQGGFPAIINPVIIPADTSNVEITFIGTVNIGGGNTTLLRKDSGKLVNPVIIDGVEGNISASNNKYYFTRLKAGTAHEVKRPQYVITKEMREHKDDIQIIFMGTNGGWMITADDAETRIKKLKSQIDMMIDYNTSKKYIIIGMHYFYSWVLYNGLTKEQLENAMLLKYGNHYINLRKYMIEYGLSDAGLTATEKDTEAINNGNVPPSLLYSDGIHGNAYFYNILANLVNKKGIELGYWN